MVSVLFGCDVVLREGNCVAAISTELPLKRRRINTGRTSPLAHSCSSESFEKGSHKSRLFIFDYSSEVIEIHIQIVFFF